MLTELYENFKKRIGNLRRYLINESRRWHNMQKCSLIIFIIFVIFLFALLFHALILMPLENLQAFGISGVYFMGFIFCFIFGGAAIQSYFSLTNCITKANGALNKLKDVKLETKSVIIQASKNFVTEDSVIQHMYESVKSAATAISGIQCVLEPPNVVKDLVNVVTAAKPFIQDGGDSG